MSNATFPPTPCSTASGGGFQKGMTMMCTPDASGNPPSGWAWLSSQSASNYDQGNGPRDDATADYSVVGRYNSGYDLAKGEGQGSVGIVQGSTGYTVVTKGADGLILMLDFVFRANAFAFTTDYFTDCKGFTLITAEQLDAMNTVVPGVPSQFLVIFQTPESTLRVIRFEQDVLNGGPLTTLFDVETTPTGFGRCLVAPNKLLLGVQKVLDLTDGTITPIAVPPPQLSYTGYTGSVLHNRVHADPGYEQIGDDVVDAPARMYDLAYDGSGALTVTTVSETGYTGSLGPYGGMLPKIVFDGSKNCWLFHADGVYLSTGGEFRQVAGRHPFLAARAKIGRAWLAGVGLRPNDMLNRPVFLNAFVQSGPIENGTYPVEQVLVTAFLGDMLASFQRKAVKQA